MVLSYNSSSILFNVVKEDILARFCYMHKQMQNENVGPTNMMHKTGENCLGKSRMKPKTRGEAVVEFEKWFHAGVRIICAVHLKKILRNFCKGMFPIYFIHILGKQKGQK